jgi:hypothetical protein
MLAVVLPEAAGVCVGEPVMALVPDCAAVVVADGVRLVDCVDVCEAVLAAVLLLVALPVLDRVGVAPVLSDGSADRVGERKGVAGGERDSSSDTTVGAPLQPLALPSVAPPFPAVALAAAAANAHSIGFSQQSVMAARICSPHALDVSVHVAENSMSVVVPGVEKSRRRRLAPLRPPTFAPALAGAFAGTGCHGPPSVDVATMSTSAAVSALAPAAAPLLSVAAIAARRLTATPGGGPALAARSSPLTPCSE